VTLRQEFASAQSQETVLTNQLKARKAALVELDRADGGDLARQRVVLDGRRPHAGERDPVRAELHPRDGAGREQAHQRQHQHRHQ